MAELLPGHKDPPRENGRKQVPCDMAGIARCLACQSHFRPRAPHEKFCSECLYWQQFLPTRGVTR